jgi:hypothetical protein
MENQKSVFATLNAINCNEHTEKKNGLTYLSWAWAWQITKSHYPDAFYTIYEDANGIPYFTDGKTCWVKTGVTIQGLEHIEYLPIMDFRNQSIPLERVTSMDMNKAIQRSLTKCIGRHGLGLYVYAGEDLPESEQTQAQTQQVQPQTPPARGRRVSQVQPTGYQPISEDNLNAMVAKYMQGIPSKTGVDYRTAWIDFTHASPAEYHFFDDKVNEFRTLTH